MKSLQQVVLIGTTAAVVAALFWLFSPKRPGEDGIRVKGGSTEIETIKGLGFDDQNPFFVSVGTTLGCYSITVAPATGVKCEGDVYTMEKVRIFTINGEQRGHDIKAGASYHLLLTTTGRDWHNAAKKVLRNDTEGFTQITAQGLKLDCTGPNKVLDATLKAMPCS